MISSSGYSRVITNVARANKTYAGIVSRTVNMPRGQNRSFLSTLANLMHIPNISPIFLMLRRKQREEKRNFQKTVKELVIWELSLIHISEPTRRTPISYAV